MVWVFQFRISRSKKSICYASTKLKIEKKMVFEKFFSGFTKSLTVKAQEEAEEEDIVDPQEVLKAECRETEHCKHLEELLQQCTDRVNSKSQTTETCAEELIDWLHAIDHCVTPKLFSRLK